MSAHEVSWAYGYSPYTGNALNIHLALADVANDTNDHLLWLAQANIAQKTRTSRRTVMNVIALMVADGFLELVEDNWKEGKPNIYRFLMPEGLEQRWAPTKQERQTLEDPSAPTRSHVRLTRLRGRAKLAHHNLAPAVGVQVLSAHVSGGVQVLQTTMPGGVQVLHGGCASSAHVTQENSRELLTQENARADLDSELPEISTAASGRARVDPPVTSFPAFEDQPRAKNSNDLFEDPASSALSAPLPPPIPPAPPAAVPEPQSPDVARVLKALAVAVAQHGGRAVKTAKWDQPIDLLLRRGPTEWATPEPIPADEILAVIDWLFGPGAVRVRGFCWADQVRSGAALRRHWLSISQARAGSPRGLAPAGQRPGRQSSDEAMAIAERAGARLQAQADAGELTREMLFPGRHRRSA